VTVMPTSDRSYSHLSARPTTYPGPDYWRAPGSSTVNFYALLHHNQRLRARYDAHEQNCTRGRGKTPSQGGAAAFMSLFLTVFESRKHEAAPHLPCAQVGPFRTTRHPCSGSWTHPSCKPPRYTPSHSLHHIVPVAMDGSNWCETHHILPIALSFPSTNLSTSFSSACASCPFFPSNHAVTFFSTYFPTMSTSMFTSSPSLFAAVTTFSCV
jgi:hypothetical protein